MQGLGQERGRHLVNEVPAGHPGRGRERGMETRERTQRLLERSGRIKPREVLEAQRKTGLTPAHNALRSRDNACGMGLLLAMNGIDAEADFSAAMLWIVRRFEHDYSEGFMRGFDGLPLHRYALDHPKARREFRKGWRDGARSRKFCFGGRRR